MESWLIIPAIFGCVVIYNVVLSCDGKVSWLFPYFLHMVDSMKQTASVGVAQARPNYLYQYHLPSYDHLRKLAI